MAYPDLFVRWWSAVNIAVALGELGIVAWWWLQGATVTPDWFFPLELGLTLGLFVSGGCWIAYMLWSDQYDWHPPDA